MELLRLTRGLGGLRLAIADGIDRIERIERFDRIGASGGVKYLGFSSLDAYGRERLGRSGRWLGDARTLNRRLAMLPLIRQAYLSGRLSTSKVKLVARALTRNGDTDDASQRTAIEHASRHSVRELRARLGEAAEPIQRPRVQITRTVDRIDALGFEGAIRLAQALGAISRTDAVEGLLAEALTTLLATHTDIGPTLAAVLSAGPTWDPPLTETVPLHHEDPADPAEEDPADPVDPIAVPLIPAEVTSIFDLDLAIRDLAAELTRRDLRLGELALEAEACGLAYHLGYDSADTCYREWLGMAPSSMAARIALARRCQRLTHVRAAVESGRIGFEAATLIARIASPATEGAWLALADTLTVKLLREHVDAAELHARLDDRPLVGLAPPTPDDLEDSHDLERHVYAMAFGIESADPCPMSVPLDPDPDPGPDLGTTTLRLSLPEDLATIWRELESAHAERLPDHTFVEFLVANALTAWRSPTSLPAYGHIYLRDRFRCQSPTCSRRNCTPHHIIFRSHGGTEAPSNLITLCEVCHLELVHGHHLTVSGQAPGNLHWQTRSRSALQSRPV